MRRIVLFGAGRVGMQALNIIGVENIFCFCDNNPKLHHKRIDKLEILNLQFQIIKSFFYIIMPNLAHIILIL